MVNTWYLAKCATSLARETVPPPQYTFFITCVNSVFIRRAPIPIDYHSSYKRRGIYHQCFFSQ